MISFVQAHGYDPGPTQRPLLAGGITGVLAAIPAGVAFIGVGSFQVVADQVIRLPRSWTVALMLAAFTVAGLLYGAIFQRAANDRRAGWLLGISYGFILWVAAPLAALPLIQRPAMAGGVAATGFFVTFLLWGFATGLLVPYVHHPLHADIDDVQRRSGRRFGPEAVALKQGLLRRHK
jgi:hypothetical protein